MRARSRIAVLLMLFFWGCGAEGEGDREERVLSLRQSLEMHEVEAISPAPAVSREKVALGEALFFDPILSGNRDSSCFTCHNPEMGTGDNRSLSVGTKAMEVDGVRMPGPRHSFMPRNSRDLYNRTQPAIASLFWDNRLGRLSDGRIVLYDLIDSYAPESYLRVMPEGLDSLLAAQNMLPVLNRTELRGDFQDTDIFGETNELSRIPDQNMEGVWKGVMTRLMGVESYRELFESAYPGVAPEERTFVEAANALAAYIGDEFTFEDSPWDAFLRGDDSALDDGALNGALLFYGKAACVQCHSGTLLSDQELYNVGVRPIESGPDVYEAVDRGAAHRSNAGRSQNFFFRTPPLRNVELTGPWMHNGAYTSLEAVVRHKIAARAGLENYDGTQLSAEFRPLIHFSEDVIASVAETLSPELQDVRLTDEEISDLVAFLHALTSPSAKDWGGVIPETAVSGLPTVRP